LAVERLARAHEALHPGASVETVLGGGAALLARMDSGGRCDVVAVGDSSLMSRFTAAAHLAVGSPRELARNRLALVVASGNPAGIESLEDLRQPNLRIALGKRSASIGRYGRWVLSRIQPSPSPAVEADTARGVLDLVAEKRADVGVVYATTTGPGDPRVKQIALPEAQNTSVLYSISRARLTEVPQAADAFIALACGSEGAKILEGSGMEARAPAK
jgi:molybdate transport system substrate-binding protein